MAKQRLNKSTSENYNPHAGDTIRKLRALKEWSQEMLGKQIHTSRSNVSRMEHSGVIPESIRDKLAKVFAVPPSMLENGNDAHSYLEPDDYTDQEQLHFVVRDLTRQCEDINDKINQLLQMTHIITRRIDIPAGNSL